VRIYAALYRSGREVRRDHATDIAKGPVDLFSRGAAAALVPHGCQRGL